MHTGNLEIDIKRGILFRHKSKYLALKFIGRGQQSAVEWIDSVVALDQSVNSCASYKRMQPSFFKSDFDIGIFKADVRCKDQNSCVIEADSTELESFKQDFI